MQTLKTPVINSGEAEQKRDEIRHYFQTTWELYERLFETLKNDSAYYERPDSLRHPLIFYFGHTATFFVNKLLVSKILNERVNPHMESMMAIGVDEMSWDDLDEQHYIWPKVSEVKGYRNQVKTVVENLIDTLPLTLPINWEDPFWIIMMGIEHERIHLETSSVLIRQLPIGKVQIHPDWKICKLTDQPPQNTLISIPAGRVELGRPLPSLQPSVTYGWDNEYGSQTTEVSNFKASEFLVSNKEYLEFIEDGGYQSEIWWSEEGWQWLQFRNATHPRFWFKADNSYRYRSMLEEIEMPWDWPVDVNYLEAKAFCNWLSAKRGNAIRLPSEAEWSRLYDLSVQQDDSKRITSEANLNLQQWASSSPVTQSKHGNLFDVVGNVWQWTETAMDGFEGFAVHPAYDDFSVPTFDGRHNLIKGGSWISTGNEAIRDSRYAFRRHFYQHAGFRYVESQEKVKQEFNTYETDELISQYLEFHYGDKYFGVDNFPKACIDAIFKACNEHGEIREFERAFDIGCAVGRSSFELAKQIPYVDALDFSTRFIRNALSLREHGQIRYLITDEGELSTLKQVKLDTLELESTADRVNFSQGDASNLKPLYKDYDLIFAGNLIDRLSQPATFLNIIHERINEDGLLVLTSPYTWLDEYTERQNWIGGYKKNGENVTTLDGLTEILKVHFEPYCDPIDVPFVIRETARKHQHTIAQMTLWRRRKS